MGARQPYDAEKLRQRDRDYRTKFCDAFRELALALAALLKVQALGVRNAELLAVPFLVLTETRTYVAIAIVVAERRSLTRKCRCRWR